MSTNSSNIDIFTKNKIDYVYIINFIFGETITINECVDKQN